MDRGDEQDFHDFATTRRMLHRKVFCGGPNFVVRQHHQHRAGPQPAVEESHELKQRQDGVRAPIAEVVNEWRTGFVGKLHRRRRHAHLGAGRTKNDHQRSVGALALPPPGGAQSVTVFRIAPLRLDRLRRDNQGQRHRRERDRAARHYRPCGPAPIAWRKRDRSSGSVEVCEQT